jgi:hypothetical protein
MPYCELHDTLNDHVKLKRLMRLLGIKKSVAMGHLICLWTYALRHAEDGDLSSMTDEEIDSEADWSMEEIPCRQMSPMSADNERQVATGSIGFTEAACRSGFLDRRADGSCVIHDWSEYCSKWKKRLQKRDERARKKGKTDTLSPLVARQNDDDCRHLSQNVATMSPLVANVAGRGEERKGEEIKITAPLRIAEQTAPRGSSDVARSGAVNFISQTPEPEQTSTAIPEKILEAQRRLESARASKSSESDRKKVNGNLGPAVSKLMVSSVRAMKAQQDNLPETTPDPPKPSKPLDAAPSCPIPPTPATTLATPLKKEILEAPVGRELDTSLLAKAIHEHRKAAGLTAYSPKNSDYDLRQDGVLQIVQLAEDDKVSPFEVVNISLHNFYACKETWLVEHDYPIGSYVKNLGRYYKPPKPVPKPKPGPMALREEGTGDQAAIYKRNTMEFERRQRELDAQLSMEGGVEATDIAEFLREIK